MTAFLKQADVRQLMAQPSPHVRAIIASKIAMEIDGPEISENEIGIAQEIIRAMAKDVEIVVRRSVAQNLRRSRHLPRDVALKLAEDVEAVSLPILADSVVLTDEDLIEILNHSSFVKQKAIATRPEISEQVCDAIIGTTDETVVATLMGNKTAHISDSGFAQAIERFTKSDVVKESMVMREHLPAMIAERLVSIVSDRLQDHLAKNHELPPHIATEILEQGRERAIITLNDLKSHEEIEIFVRQMHENRRLTATLLLRALCAGNLPFFEFAMAAMAEIPVANARQLIHDPGSEALNSLCRKVDVPYPMAQVMRMALDIMYQTKLAGRDLDMARFRASVIERVLTQTTDMDPHDQEYLLDLIK